MKLQRGETSYKSFAKPKKEPEALESDIYLQNTTKERPITVGGDMFSPVTAISRAASAQRHAIGSQTNLKKAAMGPNWSSLYQNKTDYEIGAEEQQRL